MRMRAMAWVCRIAFGAVFLLNITCAVQFIVDPGSSVAAYELDGAAGIVAMQGLGVAFLMWNATYPLFIFDPVRFRVLGFVIIAQQSIGAVGESAIFASISRTSLGILSSSILRFMIFDYAGLIVMLVALILLLFTRFRADDSEL